MLDRILRVMFALMMGALSAQLTAFALVYIAFDGYGPTLPLWLIAVPVLPVAAGAYWYAGRRGWWS